MKKHRIIVCLTSVFTALFLLLSIPLYTVADGTTDVTALYKNRDTVTDWDPNEAQQIRLDELTEKTLCLTQEGDYVLSGSFDGQVVIKAGKEDIVRLILCGASIVSQTGPAIYEKQADKLIITLAEGTQNSLTDASPLTEGDDTIGAGVYAEDDLTINGAGELVVNGTQKHGIQSKADLILAGGTISVSAVKDGIRGRNSILLLGGSLIVSAGSDGLITTRDDKEGKGWIVLYDGSVTVTTGGGAGEATVISSQKDRGHSGFRGTDWNMDTSAAIADNPSRKGIKAASELTVLGGSYTLDCEDDALHAAAVTLDGGSFTIRSGDDGIHADGSLILNSGNVSILQCSEGLEGADVTLNGGEISILSSDDGVNASGEGGSTASFRSGGFGGAGENSGTLTINGGTLTVNAGGDALDSNGSITIAGGVIGIWSATTKGEGTIDFNASGLLSGGTLIMATTGGVMQDTAGMSGQSILSLETNGAQAAGTEIRLLDGDENLLAFFTPAYAYDTVLISSSLLPDGSPCSVLCGGETLYSGEMSNTINTAVTENAGFRNGRGNRKGF